MSIFDRINAGEYEPKGGYPARPKEPAILRKRASELTREEAAQINDAKLDHEQCMKDFLAARLAYGKVQSQLHRKFQEDLCEENGVDSETAFAQEMLSIAWEQGRSSGHREVAIYFDDLLPLWEIYKATLVESK